MRIISESIASVCLHYSKNPFYLQAKRLSVTIRTENDRQGGSFMASGFFSMLLRMKYIDRWSLMRNTQRETLAEHTIDTAILAHALAVIGQTRFHRNIDPERTAVLAMFHDASEIITGDMPTPVKYHNARITAAYKEVEAEANRTLLDALPGGSAGGLSPAFVREKEDAECRRFVKAADKLSALIKCIEERRSGNMEFADAERDSGRP